MSALPGKINEVALYVRVSASEKLTVRTAPAAIVPNDVIAVVPVMFTMLEAAAPISVVAAEAIVTGVA
jgi:hypothetical protein